MVPDMALHPGHVLRQSRRRCSHDVTGFGKPRHRDVGLDPTLLIQELGVDNLARRNANVIAANTVQESLGIAPLNTDLAERRHVIDADIGAHSLVLARRVFKPVLALPGVAVFAFLAVIGKPVGPLPTGNFAKHGPAGLHMLVKRRAPHTARRGHLSIGEVVRIEQAQRLRHAVGQIGLVALERLHPANVDIR